MLNPVKVYFSSRCGSTTYPLCLVSNETDSSEAGTPSVELVPPVVQGGLGADDQMRRGDAAVVLHVTQQGYRLESLAQTLITKTQHILHIPASWPSLNDDTTMHCLPSCPIETNMALPKEYNIVTSETISSI